MKTLQLPRLATMPATQLRPLAWIIRLNAAYRERAKMATLDDAARRDMGLPRRDADQTRIADILSRASRY